MSLLSSETVHAPPDICILRRCEDPTAQSWWWCRRTLGSVSLRSSEEALDTGVEEAAIPATAVAEIQIRPQQGPGNRSLPTLKAQELARLEQ